MDFKLIFIFEWIVQLGIRHTTGIKPAVDNLGRPFHITAALPALQNNIVDIRFMQV